MFSDLLHSIQLHHLLMQTNDGLLLLGQNGERIVNHYSFYSSFLTPAEYRLVYEGRTIGTIWAEYRIGVDSFVTFAGRRWVVLNIDSTQKVIILSPAESGNVPIFGGDGGLIHDRVRQEMYRVYQERNIPSFLDRKARQLLQEAQENFHRLGLSNNRMVVYNARTYIFLWVGDKVLNTLVAMLNSKGLNTDGHDFGISVVASKQDDLRVCMHDLVAGGLPDAYDLAKSIPYEHKVRNKYDKFLTDELLSADYASSNLDAKGAYEALKGTLQILG